MLSIPDTPSADDLRRSVRDKYAAVARGETLSCCRPADGAAGSTADGACSPAEINMIGDAYDGVDGYAEAADLKLGCGLPVEHAGLAPGQTVLDLGAGAGLDAFVARRIVGEAGTVLGVDFTPEMVERARANAPGARLRQRPLRARRHRGAPVRGRERGRRGLELRAQPRPGQGPRLRRDAPRAPPGRPLLRLGRREPGRAAGRRPRLGRAVRRVRRGRDRPVGVPRVRRRGPGSSASRSWPSAPSSFRRRCCRRAPRRRCTASRSEVPDRRDDTRRSEGCSPSRWQTASRSRSPHRDVVVVGGGQAALAVGYYLTRALREAGATLALLDDQPGPGGAWQAGWDSLRLFSPAEWSSLPGTLLPRHLAAGGADAPEYPQPRRRRELPRRLRGPIRVARLASRPRPRRPSSARRPPGRDRPGRRDGPGRRERDGHGVLSGRPRRARPRRLPRSPTPLVGLPLACAVRGTARARGRRRQLGRSDRR